MPVHQISGAGACAVVAPGPQRHSVRATGKLQAGSGERGPGTTAMTIAEFKDTFTTAAQLREVLGQPLFTSSAMDTDGSMFDW